MFYKNKSIMGIKGSGNELIEVAREQSKKLKDAKSILEKRHPNLSSRSTINRAKRRMQRIVSVYKLKSMYILKT